MAGFIQNLLHSPTIQSSSSTRSFDMAMMSPVLNDSSSSLSATQSNRARHWRGTAEWTTDGVTRLSSSDGLIMATGGGGLAAGNRC